MKILLALTSIFSFLIMMASAYGIVGFLENRGNTISYFDLRSEFNKHLKKYIRITKTENGKVGIYFYLLVTSTLIGMSSFLCFLYLTITMKA